MNNTIETGRGFHSPKKKLSFRNKESSIENVRRDLKDAKDISARNLMAKLDLDEQEKNDSDSTIEEVVVIEEETEEVEDEDVEYVEEIIDDSDDDDSYLEPLPPPIEIPEALKVKDEDDNGRFDKSGSDDDSDGDESTQEAEPRIQVSSEAKMMVDESGCVDEPKEEKLNRPTASQPIQVSCAPKIAPDQEAKEKTGPTSYIAEEEPIVSKQNVALSSHCLKPRKECFATVKEDTTEEKEVNVLGAKSVRPAKQRGMSYLDHDIGVPISKQATTFVDQPTTIHSINNESQESDPSIAWQKPDWTKNTKLRPTGKSTKENLAKPITILPHLVNRVKDGFTTSTVADPGTPVSSKPKVKANPTTPTPSSNTIARTQERQCPKSAPSLPKAPVLMDQDALPKIEWTKPEWTRKKILRDTSKGQKLMSGQEISRPIGGIRPVQN